MAVPFGHLLKPFSPKFYLVKPSRSVAATPQKSLWTTTLDNLRRSLHQWLTEPVSGLKVWCKRDRTGYVWWYAYDSVKQEGLRKVSEQEILIWIERHRSR